MDINSKSELGRATLLCFFSYKETQCCFFTMSDISGLMEHSGYSRPNTSRLKEKLTKGKGKVMLLSKINKGALEFIPTVLQGLEKEIGTIWNDTEIIISSSELIEEAKFAGREIILTA